MKAGFIALTLVMSLMSSLAQAKENCHLLSCPDLSRNDIDELKNEDLIAKYANDPKVRAEHEKRYSKWYNQDLETFLKESLEREVQYFKSMLDSRLSAIASVEEEFDVRIPDDLALTHGKGQRDLSILAGQGRTCLVAVEKDDRKKNCRSRRRSCAGQIAFIFTLGTLGSANCSPAYTRCSYHRDWDLLVKTSSSTGDTVTQVSTRTEGEYNDDEHRVFLMGPAAKARKQFKAEEKVLKDLINSLPKCERKEFK